MDIDGVIEVCDKFGLLMSRPYVSPDYGANVSISCPLAPWTHGDPIDGNKSCSVTLNQDGPSMARCHSFSCDYRGSLWFLIQRSVLARDPVPKHLIEFMMRIAKTEEPSLENDFDRIGSTYDPAYDASVVEIPPIPLEIRPPPGVSSKMRRAQTLPRIYDRDVMDERFLDQFSQDLPAYVFERGITIETAKRWELRYDERLGRVVCPCRRFDGRLIGVTGRILPSRETEMLAVGQEVTKYHNYAGLNKTRYLYGAHTFIKGRPLILTEGPFDLYKTWQALHTRASVGATLGQGFGEDHRKTVVDVSKAEAVYLFFDDDQAGRRAAEKVGAMLETELPILLMRPQGGKDPGAMECPAIVTAFEDAVPIVGDIVAALAGLDPLA